ncbi:hypothetical protein [Helicobacter mesocricetorum]|uniref:hypothetical protein n=1 Tax=Helicobacter mesocricetorum TaxID=87012 RepID=UPI000CF0F414|nr:hypothetical protein [Helicobacter mesocricetorum]
MREKIQVFCKKVENLYSKKRLESYANSVGEHNKNLRFIAKISYKIAVLEISLRNMLDYCMQGQFGENWIWESNNEYLKEKIAEIQAKESKQDLSLEHHQILSRLTLGVIARLIKEFKLQNSLLDLNDLTFKQYSQNNFDTIRKGYRFRNYQKVNIALNLIVTIRNRAFHWENLNKRKNIGNYEISRIFTTAFKEVFISIEPRNIEKFLDDLIDRINKDLKNP